MTVVVAGVHSWSVQDVLDWLARCNLQHLAPTFAENEVPLHHHHHVIITHFNFLKKVDGRTLVGLTKDDIKNELHVTGLRDRKDLYEALQKLHLSLEVNKIK